MELYTEKIETDSASWIEIVALAPNSVGKSVNIYNMGESPLSVIVADLEPVSDDGFIVPINRAWEGGSIGQYSETITIDAAVKIWCRTSNGKLKVLLQEVAQSAGAASEVSLLALLTAVQSYIRAEDSPHTSGEIGIPMLGIRSDNDVPTAGDNDYTILKLDEQGRLKVSSKPASYPDITGDITAIQATINTPVAGGTVSGDVSRASNIMAFCTGTFAGVNVSFEGSLEDTGDGNWFGVQAARTNSNTIETATGALSAQPVYAWELSVNALARIRVRCTARTSGTQSWRFKQGTYATEPIPAAQVSATQPVSGSVTSTLAAAVTRAAFVAGAGIWYDDTSTNLGISATFTGTNRDATVTATATAFANAATYTQEIRAFAESDVAGTLWIEYSRDNTNWRRAKSVATAAVTGGGQAAEILFRPSWRYWRVGYTNGGTAQARFALGSLAMGI